MIKGPRTSVLDKLRRAREAAERRPLDHVLWLPGQWAIFHDARRYRLFRAGNQSQGKTWAGLAECIWEAEGEHPYREVTAPDRPAVVWVICASWLQSIEIQGKLWALLDKSRLHPKTVFDPITGFRGKNPAVRVRHRCGGWSIIRIKTTQQGALNLAGATIDFALFDEPPATQRVYSEVKRRVQRNNGRILVTMTPINRDVGYMKEEVAAGMLHEHHYTLDAANMIPVGQTQPITLADGTPCDQAWIDSVRAEVLEFEAPVLLDGEWEFRSVGRAFHMFDATRHVKPPPVAVEEEHLVAGLDHGGDVIRERINGKRTMLLGRQCAILAVVQRWPGETHPRVHVLDCVRATRETTPDEDAEAFLEMLRRNGEEWSSLDRVLGDRVHMAGSAKRKGNRDFQVAMSKRLKLRGPDALVPPVRTAKRGTGRGAGSVNQGCRWLMHRMIEPNGFSISPQATGLIEALLHWDLTPNSPWKDPIDALRYALDEEIFGAQAARQLLTLTA